jgi:hypothetical protein
MLASTKPTIAFSNSSRFVADSKWAPPSRTCSSLLLAPVGARTSHSRRYRRGPPFLAFTAADTEYKSHIKTISIPQIDPILAHLLAALVTIIILDDPCPQLRRSAPIGDF